MMTEMIEVISNELIHARKVGDYKAYTVHVNGSNKNIGRIYMEVDGDWVYQPNDNTGFFRIGSLKSIINIMESIQDEK